jgi:hypothetical protein
LLPGDDIALQAGGEPVVAVGVLDEPDEAAQLQGQFASDFRGADPSDSKALIAVRPERQAIRRGHAGRVGDRDTVVIPFVK